MAHFKDIVPAIPLSNSVTSIQNGLSEILYLKHRARARNWLKNLHVGVLCLRTQ